jgi:hypothetical protein
VPLCGPPRRSTGPRPTWAQDDRTPQRFTRTTPGHRLRQPAAVAARRLRPHRPPFPRPCPPSRFHVRRQSPSLSSAGPAPRQSPSTFLLFANTTELPPCCSAPRAVAEPLFITDERPAILYRRLRPRYSMLEVRSVPPRQLRRPVSQSLCSPCEQGQGSSLMKHRLRTTGAPPSHRPPLP